MGGRQVRLTTGAERHLYCPLDHKPIRQQQKLTTLNDLVALTHSYDALRAIGRPPEAQRHVDRILKIDANNDPSVPLLAIRAPNRS